MNNLNAKNHLTSLIERLTNFIKQYEGTVTSMDIDNIRSNYLNLRQEIYDLCPYLSIFNKKFYTESVLDYKIPDMVDEANNLLSELLAEMTK